MSEKNLDYYDKQSKEVEELDESEKNILQSILKEEFT